MRLLMKSVKEEVDNGEFNKRITCGISRWANQMPCLTAADPQRDVADGAVTPAQTGPSWKSLMFETEMCTLIILALEQRLRKSMDQT